MFVALVALGDCKDFGPCCLSNRGDEAARGASKEESLRGEWDYESMAPARPPNKDPTDPTSRLYDSRSYRSHLAALRSPSGTEGDLAWCSRRLRQDGERLGRQMVVFNHAQSYPYLILTLRAPASSPAKRRRSVRGEAC